MSPISAPALELLDTQIKFLSLLFEIGSKCLGLIQPFPVSCYFKNYYILTYVTYLTENIHEVVHIRHIRM